MIKVSPSILSADFSEMGKTAEKLAVWGADYIHCDVIDGQFAPNITFGPKMVADIKKHAKLPLDVHLMVVEPDRYIDRFIDAGADILTIHAEAAVHLDKAVRHIKDSGIKCGVALNPATPPDSIKYLLNEIDMVLIMSVNPGFSGQKFIEYSYEKISDTKKLIGSRNVEIEVDGGACPDNAAKLHASGAGVLVAGNAVFCAQDPAAAIKAMQNAQ